MFIHYVHVNVYMNDYLHLNVNLNVFIYRVSQNKPGDVLQLIS